jgi:hypothetical protein
MDSLATLQDQDRNLGGWLWLAIGARKANNAAAQTVFFCQSLA